MYVCICNAITEKKLREAANDTAVRSAKQAYNRLGCAVDCGQCLKAASDVLVSARCSPYALAAE